MIKRLIFTTVMMTVMAVAAVAQETIYLIKDNQVVAKYGADEVDCMAFSLPEGVIDNVIGIIPGNVTKNSLQYTVKTTSADMMYVHLFMQENTVNNYLLTYYGHDISTASTEEKENIIRTILYDGYLGKGTSTFNIKDGESDGNAEFEVLAGQRYIIAVSDINAAGDGFGENLYYTTVQTEAPGRCKGTVGVSYAGLTDEGGALFKFTADSDITRIYTMYGKKANIDAAISAYGLEYCMTTFAGYFAPSYLLNDTEGWVLYGEDDYSLYVMGIDADGNWTEIKSVTEHIVPPVPETVGPQITIGDKEKGNGNVKINFEISPSNVTEAYVRLMDENDCDDSQNAGYTLAELAAGGDAIDITNDINTMGEYTYVGTNIPEKWYALLIMGKNAEGTTVQRINFLPDTDTLWSIYDAESFPASGAKPHKASSASRAKKAVSFDTVSKTAAIKNVNGAAGFRTLK